MIKAIIFDLDNTLIDFFYMKKMSIEASAYAMIDAGLKQKKERIVKELFTMYDQYGWEDQTIFQKYLRKTEKKINYKVLAAAINAYRRVRTGFLEPYPGVRDTLFELKRKDIKLALVTDAPKLQAWLRLDSMKLDHFFDVIVAFEDTHQRKPSRKPFDIALKRLKLKPEECLMVGDMPDRDLVGAKRIGMKACFAKYGHRKGKAKVKADYEIDYVSELLKIVKQQQ